MFFLFKFPAKGKNIGFSFLFYISLQIEKVFPWPAYFEE